MLEMSFLLAGGDPSTAKTSVFAVFFSAAAPCFWGKLTIDRYRFFPCSCVVSAESTDQY
ncbi:hypothetical protein SynWH8103_01085 [Synechococcus sp. WH 8103]|nr:hypothetical protein SynWH8103_01085 [Synechococcus sp. WH 8103]